MDWFNFKGMRSDYMGMRVTAFPPDVVAQERIKSVTVPGRSGSLNMREEEDVFDDVEIEVECAQLPGFDFDRVRKWLTGSGSLTLSRDPRRSRRARVSDQVEYRKIIRGMDHRSVTISFTCDPYLYRAEPTMDRAAPNRPPYTMSNPGTVEALPLIHITGTGDISVLVGDRAFSLTGMSGTVIIDCDAKCAYKGTIENQVAITLDDKRYPVLGVGETVIRWSGAVQKIVIDPNWRWL